MCSVLRGLGIWLVVCLCMAGTVWANAGNIACQGRLNDIYGRPLTGDYKISFSIHETEETEADIWEETQTISIHEGLFSVKLGEINPISLPFGPDYWIGITIEGEALQPRYKLSSLGAAYRLDTGEYRQSESAVLENLSLTGSNIIQDVVLSSNTAHLTSGEPREGSLKRSYTDDGLSITNAANDATQRGNQKTPKNSITLISGKSEDYSVELSASSSIYKTFSSNKYDIVLVVFNEKDSGNAIDAKAKNGNAINASNNSKYAATIHALNADTGNAINAEADKGNAINAKADKGMAIDAYNNNGTMPTIKSENGGAGYAIAALNNGINPTIFASNAGKGMAIDAKAKDGNAIYAHNNGADATISATNVGNGMAINGWQYDCVSNNSRIKWGHW